MMPKDRRAAALKGTTAVRKGRDRGRIDGGDEVSVSDRKVTRKHCKVSQHIFKKERTRLDILRSCSFYQKISINL